MPNRSWEVSLVQAAYKNATIVAFRSVWRRKSKTFFKCIQRLSFTLSVAYVNHSLKNWTRSMS